MTNPKHNPVTALLEEIDAAMASDLSLTKIRESLSEWGIDPNVPPDLKARLAQVAPKAKRSDHLPKAPRTADYVAPREHRTSLPSTVFSQDLKKSMSISESSHFASPCADADIRQSLERILESRDWTLEKQIRAFLDSGALAGAAALMRYETLQLSKGASVDSQLFSGRSPEDWLRKLELFR